MIPLISYFQSTEPVLRGLLEIDSDPATTRFCVMDRVSLEIVRASSPSVIESLVVPVDYTVGFELMVLIFDDSGDPAFYVTGNDKVQAQLINARTLTPVT
jgi:hypothetical protein